MSDDEQEIPVTAEGQIAVMVRTLQDQIKALESRLQSQDEVIRQQQSQLNERSDEPPTGTPTVGNTPPSQNWQELQSILLRTASNGLQSVDRIENYTGGNDFDMFVDSIVFVAAQNKWSDDTTLQVIESKLRDRAKEYYLALKTAERPRKVSEMRAWLRSIFSRTASREDSRRELARCIRNSEESLGSYVHRLKIIANRIFPEDHLTTAQTHHRDRLIVEQFLQGIDLRLANRVLSVGECYQIEEALVIAEDHEAVIGRHLEENAYDNMKSAIRAVRVTPATTNADFRNHERRGSEAQRGRYRQRLPQRVGERFNTRYPRMAGRCKNCLQVGHDARGCKNPTERPVCYSCATLGSHSTEQCPLNCPEASELRRN